MGNIDKEWMMQEIYETSGTLELHTNPASIYE
jgi:hypothetical protein